MNHYSLKECVNPYLIDNDLGFEKHLKLTDNTPLSYITMKCTHCNIKIITSTNCVSREDQPPDRGRNFYYNTDDL